jgi:hypothetical protein
VHDTHFHAISIEDEGKAEREHSLIPEAIGQRKPNCFVSSKTKI